MPVRILPCSSAGHLFRINLRVFFALLAVCLLPAVPVLAQLPALDSLQKLLTTARDTQRVQVLNELVWLNRSQDTAQAFRYARESQQLARKLGYDKGLAQSLNDMGILYYDRSAYIQALRCYNESLVIRKRLRDDKGLAALYNKIGIVEQAKGDYQHALQSQLKALELFEKVKFEYGIAQTLNNIAVLNYDIGHSEKALTYYLQSLAMKRKIGDKAGEAGTLVNIGNIYHERKGFPQAINYFMQALPILRKLNDQYYLSATLNNLGASMVESGQAGNALQFLLEGLAIREKMSDQKGMASSLINLGQAYGTLKRYPEAKDRLEKAHALAVKVGAKPEQVRATMLLAGLYENTGNYPRALAYQREYASLRDSVISEERTRQMAEMQTRFESDKKDGQIRLLHQQQKIKELQLAKNQTQQNLLLLALGAVIITGTGLLYAVRLKQKQKHDRALLKEQSNRLKAVIETQEEERKRIAGDLHDSLGQMLSIARMNLATLREDAVNGQAVQMQHMENLLDRSISEVRTVAHSMMPSVLTKLGLRDAIEEFAEQINDSGKLQLELKPEGLQERLPDEAEIAVFRVIQELVNNIVKHAQASRVDILTERGNGRLRITVKDNGKGFDAEKLKRDGGNGWYNIKSRMSLLHGSTDISSVPGAGTQVVISIPV